MNNGAVLLLNQNYEPLNVCNMRRAIVMVFGGKAEILENSRGYIRSVHQAWPVPSVIRLNYMVHRPLPRVRLCRKEVFRRDEYTCQYCGRKTHRLTMDHVMPRYRGGRHSWQNLVSACPACNRRKGGKTLDQAHMNLLREPFEPRPTGKYLFGAYLEGNEEWGKFLQGWWE
jgi:5-methylcytosine-specific restriction endonuclease McrA